MFIKIIYFFNMFFDLKNMLNFNFYFFKFAKKQKIKYFEKKSCKQKLKKIFQHVFKIKKHVELKFLKFIKHVEIILQILIKLKQHVYKNFNNMFIKIIYFFNMFFDLKNMLNFNFYFFKFAKKQKIK